MEQTVTLKSERRISTLLGLILMLVGLGTAIFLVESGSALLSRAAASSTPDEINIVNVSDSAVSVSWVTHVPTRGSLNYREKAALAIPQTAFDIRDQTSPEPRYTHFVTITGLKAQTAYEFTLVSGQRTYSDKLLSSLITPGALPPPARLVSPAFGTLADAQGNPVADALVYASFNGSQTLGTIVDPDGSWVIPLGTMRTAKGYNYFYPTPQDEERISFASRFGSVSTTTNVDNDSPLPPVRLSPLKQRLTHIIQPVMAQAQDFSSITGSASGPFEVYYPQDRSSISSGKPAFKGKGIAGAKVIISVIGPGSPIVGQTTVSPNGTWSWTPPALSPGAYTAAIVSFTSDKTPITVTRSFSILKNGSAVLQASTTSGSLATPAPTAAASPLASASPSTSSPRPSATISASPTSSASASPGAIPSTGSTEPTLALLILGSLITFIGVINLTRTKSALDTG